MKERPEFKEGNAAFAKALNQVVEYARLHGVNVAGLTDWEETVDGWRKRHAPASVSSNALRPFQVREVAPDPELEDPDPVVQVNTGRICGIGFPTWLGPSWVGGDAFNTDKILTESHTLWAFVTFSQTEVTSEFQYPTMSASLEWIPAADGAPDRDSGVQELEIDFSGESVTTTFYPASSYTIRFQVAAVVFDAGEIFRITQYLDHNPVLPSNAHKYFDVVEIFVP